MRPRLFASVLIVAALAGFAIAQEEVAVSAKAPQSAKAGKAFDLVLTVNVPAGYHIYGNKLNGDLGVPTSIKIKAPAGVKLGTIKYPATKTLETAGQKLPYWEGTVKFIVPVTATSKNVGKNSFNVDIRYQMCNDRICLPPQTAKASATTTVKG